MSGFSFNSPLYVALLGADTMTAPPPPAGDPSLAAANLFISEAAITDPGQQSAIRALTSSLFSSGIWPKLRALWPMVGVTIRAHSRNLKDPYDTDAAHRLTFPNGATFGPLGTDFNGTNQYANTHLIVDNISNAGLAYYHTEPATTYNDVCMGSYPGGSGSDFYMQIYNGGSNSVFTAGGNTYAIFATGPIGLLQGNSDGGVQLYRNGALLAAQGGGFMNSTILPVAIGGMMNGSEGNVTNFVNANCALASINFAFTAADVTAFYNMVQQYQTALGRAV